MTGTYYLDAGAFRDSGLGSYAIRAITIDDEPTNTPDTTKSLSTGSGVTGNIEVGFDHDWFAVQLTAGHSYAINVRGSFGSGGTLWDPTLSLHDANGMTVASGQPNRAIFSAPDFPPIPADEQLVVTVSQSGTYYVDVGGLVYRPDIFFPLAGQTGTYTVDTEDLGTTTDRFPLTQQSLADFGTDAGGWTSQDQYPRTLADVNSDGRPDIVGFSSNGLVTSLNQGGGQFGASNLVLPEFGTNAGGWTSQDQYPRTLANVNSDGWVDIVGFSSNGAVASLGQAGGNFGAPQLVLSEFGTNVGGWTSQDQYPRFLADVNGDAKTDIVGFSSHGVIVSLNQSVQQYSADKGFYFELQFGAPQLVLSDFGTDAGGWTSQDQYPRFLADVNGDRKADIVGFSSNGVVVSLNDGLGHFAAPQLVLSEFGTEAGGWTSQDQYPRFLADVNGDGRADIIGFSSHGAVVSLATGAGGFAAPALKSEQFGTNAGGWTSQDQYPRALADVNANAKADIVGFSSNGVNMALSYDYVPLDGPTAPVLPAVIA